MTPLRRRYTHRELRRAADGGRWDPAVRRLDEEESVVVTTREEKEEKTGVTGDSHTHRWRATSWGRMRFRSRLRRSDNLR